MSINRGTSKTYGESTKNHSTPLHSTPFTAVPAITSSPVIPQRKHRHGRDVGRDGRRATSKRSRDQPLGTGSLNRRSCRFFVSRRCYSVETLFWSCYQRSTQTDFGREALVELQVALTAHPHVKASVQVHRNHICIQHCQGIPGWQI